MKKKAIIAIASLLTFGQGAWAQTTSFPRHGETGENSESNPYKIESIDDLNALASDVNSGTDYSGVYFQMTTGLDYSEVSLCFDLDEDGTNDSNFAPIGCYAMDENYNDDPKYFKGVFDGNKKTITGITVSNPTYPGIGLFGYISDATINDLTLVNCTFIGNMDVGSIAGCSELKNDKKYSTIENCKVEGGTVTAEKIVQASPDEDIPGEDVGGIIGFSNDNLVLTNCTSSATVTGDNYVGGIIGKAGAGDATYGQAPKLSDCYYTGASNITAIGKIVGEKAATINITLLNDDSNATATNSTRIANYDGKKATVTLDSRTLYKDGAWNTLCLPFDVTVGSGQMAGATAMTLTTSDFSASLGVLTLNFDDVTSNSTISAGTPFIVKWTGTDVSDPVFSGVTINNTQSTTTSTDKVNFVGSFSPVGLTANDKAKLYLGDASTLYYPNAAMTIGACRAYFQLHDIDGAREFKLNFGNDGSADDSSASGIAVVSPATPADGAVHAPRWYDLQGRRIKSSMVNGQSSMVNGQLKKGIYIHNGKKVLVRDKR